MFSRVFHVPELAGDRTRNQLYLVAGIDVPAPVTLEDSEREHILPALDQTGG